MLPPLMCQSTRGKANPRCQAGGVGQGGDGPCAGRDQPVGANSHSSRARTSGLTTWVCTCRGVPPGIGAGVYASAPWETSFLALTEGAGWRQPYGDFFLSWYSGALVKHAEDVLDATLPVLGYKFASANSLDINNDGKVDMQDLFDL